MKLNIIIVLNIFASTFNMNHKENIINYKVKTVAPSDECNLQYLTVINTQHTKHLSVDQWYWLLSFNQQ